MSDWQKMYQEKLVSAEGAAAAIESGDHIWFPVGAGEPYSFISALADRRESLKDVTTYQILPAKPGYFDEETSQSIKHNSLFTSGASREAVQAGWSDVTPNYFHEIPRLIREYWSADVAGAIVSPMDEHGFFSMGLGVDYTWEAIKKAKKVIFEINPDAPRCHGNCQVHVSKVTHIIECDDRSVTLLKELKKLLPFKPVAMSG